MKTVSVALVLCLNVGVDPPDVVKTQPCARLECWIGKTNNLLLHLFCIVSFKYYVAILKNHLLHVPFRSNADVFSESFRENRTDPSDAVRTMAA